MKKFVIFAVIIVVTYSIYHDLSSGTIQTSLAKTVKVETGEQTDPYSIIEISPGDTVLSIMEEKGPLPVPISEIVTDFTQLNDGLKPEQIQVGKSYKFPKYDRDIR